MKRPTIAVDLDDVLADSAAGFVAFSNQKWGTNLTVEDYSEHWSEMWGTDHAETMQRAGQIYEKGVANDFSVLDGAKDVLTKLSARFNLIIVTSRSSRIQKDTLQWIEQYYNGIFSSIHFSGIWDKPQDLEAASKITKANILQELGADYLIDDHPKHCFAVAEAGIPAVLFGNYKWSRDLELPSGVTRATTWVEVEEYFNGVS